MHRADDNERDEVDETPGTEAETSSDGVDDGASEAPTEAAEASDDGETPVGDDVIDAEEPVEPELLDPEALQAELVATRAALMVAESSLDTARSELSEMTERLRAVSRGFQEQKAEMAAFRSRMEERADLEKARRRAEVVRSIFEPVQNLQRSQDAEGDVEAFREGVRMVHQQFMDALTGLGLRRTPGTGSPFDPNLHEALALVPVEDAALDGCVVDVFDDGWMVDGRAIRAAKVTVGKVEAAEPEPEA